MPEHVHLLLSEPQQDTLADALRSVRGDLKPANFGNLVLTLAAYWPWDNAVAARVVSQATGIQIW